jgi:hypothetical protein
MRSLIAVMMLLAVFGCDPGPSPAPDTGLTVEESATCVALLWLDATLTARAHGAFQMRFSPPHYGHAAKTVCPDNYFVADIVPVQPGTLLTASGPLAIGVDIGTDNTRSCAALTGAVEIDYLHREAGGRSLWQRTSMPIVGQLSSGNCNGSYSVTLPANSDVMEARVGVNGQISGSQVTAEIWIDN